MFDIRKLSPLALWLGAACSSPAGTSSSDAGADTSPADAPPGVESGAPESGAPDVTADVAPSLTWSPVSTSVTDDLTGVWGSGASDVWVVGGYSRLHYDGQSWTTETMMTRLAQIHGSSASDVWAVGDTVSHYDGSKWTGDPFFDLNMMGTVRPAAVWSGGGEGWVVGYSGHAVHRTGAAWTAANVSTTEDLNAVFGTGPNDVYAVGTNGCVAHWNGSAWSTSPGSSLATSNWLFAVWQSAPADVWVAGGFAGDSLLVRYDGSQWTRLLPNVSTTVELRGVWGSSKDDVWAAGGETGLVHAVNGTAASVTVATTQALNAVWGSSASDVWVVGNAGTVLHHP